ncbi:MAG: esterase-like activity of phytase family protein [Pseudobdellovibrio sp.]
MSQLKNFLRFKIAIVFLFLGISEVEAKVPKVTFKKMWQISAQIKYQKNELGGVSGCSLNGDKIYFAIDDRGNKGVPRVLILNWDKSKHELDVKNFRWSNLNTTKGKILDIEGIAVTDKNKILLSNEGDLNQKPRQAPEIFMINNQGKRILQVALPDKFIPNPSGEQTKGIQNNFGFEGLTLDKEQKKWGAFLEGPLVQDTSNLWLIEGALNGSFAVTEQWSYKLPVYEGAGIGLAMGVTDFLYHSSQNLIVLERGLDLSLQGMKFNSQLCYAEKDSHDKKLKKECFYDFAQDTPLIKEIKAVANFEGLCWLNEEKTQFLVVSDNNFSKNQNTLFLLYEIE